MNAPCSDGRTPFHTAAADGRTEKVRLMLKHGADVHRQTDYDVTALGYAASGGHPDVVKLLLDAGADAKIINPDDFTALDLAATPVIYRELKKAVL